MSSIWCVCVTRHDTTSWWHLIVFHYIYNLQFIRFSFSLLISLHHQKRARVNKLMQIINNNLLYYNFGINCLKITVVTYYYCCLLHIFHYSTSSVTQIFYLKLYFTKVNLLYYFRNEWRWLIAIVFAGFYKRIVIIISFTGEVEKWKYIINNNFNSLTKPTSKKNTRNVRPNTVSQ